MRIANYEQCVMDNEILGATFRMLRGIDTSREAIGVDVFQEVRHAGNFLQTMHSVKYCKSNERWSPKITDRGNWNQWLNKTNGKDMRERAKDEVKKILAEHNPSYATQEEKKMVWEIADEAQKVIIEKQKKSH
jgi:trimethylamine---corrinoid protein Co-methyltransferase